MDNENLLDIAFDLNIIKEKIPTYTSVKLCEMIVCTRYLGLDQQICLECMKELANRRVDGDTFDFELYIEKESKDMPVLDFSTLDFRSILNQVMKK